MLLSELLSTSFNSCTQQITFVDFIMYELFDQHRMFHPTCFDDFKNLKEFLDRFEVRPLPKSTSCTFNSSLTAAEM